MPQPPLISVAQFLELFWGASPEEINHWCIGRLEAFDYIVQKRGKWEHLRELLKRLHISGSKFRRRLKRYPRETASFIETGPTGRTVRIRSDADLDRFLSNGGKNKAERSSAKARAKAATKAAKAKKMAASRHKSLK